MNKILFLLGVFFFFPFYSFAQEDDQTSILTDDGIFTVSKTEEGRDMILVNIHLWDDIVKGTKYISGNLATTTGYFACIVITNKKQKLCKAGIGFRCGIFDGIGINGLKPSPALVNNSNRVCTVMIQIGVSASVKIVFLDKVDWFSLQNEQ